MADDNIIQFPLDKIVRKTTKSNSSKAEKQFAERIKQKQTKEFCDTAVDDISMNVLRSFVDLALKTQNQNFTKDLALLIDVLRGLIYRDFNMKHPSQVLSEKMVELKVNRDGGQSARINYDIFHKGKVNKPLSKEIKEELKDGPGIFEPDGDLDK